jgi:hypothetical protein
MDLPLQCGPLRAGAGERVVFSMESSPCSAILLLPPRERVTVIQSGFFTQLACSVVFGLGGRESRF